MTFVTAEVEELFELVVPDAFKAEMEQASQDRRLKQRWYKHLKAKLKKTQNGFYE